MKSRKHFDLSELHFTLKYNQDPSQVFVLKRFIFNSELIELRRQPLQLFNYIFHTVSGAVVNMGINYPGKVLIPVKVVVEIGRHYRDLSVVEVSLVEINHIRETNISSFSQLLQYILQGI